MSLWEFIVAVILGLVEGITEFLPISSTGHLIAVGEMLRFSGDRAATFQVVIQIGAILAVMWHYRATLIRLLRHCLRPGPEQRLTLNVIIAFLPAAVLGLLLIDLIKSLFDTSVVGWALIVGGVVMLWLEWREPETTAPDIADVRPIQALVVGLAQCLAMIPGTSRAAATILGGYAAGLSRPAATEFSFLLAIPTICGAGVLDLWQSRDLLSVTDVPFFAVGTLVAFVSALVVIRSFLRFVQRHTFVGFAWYRIAFGSLLLALIATGVL